MTELAPQSLTTLTTFGELLKHLRQRIELTQQEFGLAVGYSRAHVARLENGQRVPEVAAVRARFIETLRLEDEPAMAARLIELAIIARDRSLPKPIEHPPNNLPLQLTSFVGRERELAELRRLLPSTRLLTLTGAGGVGKTRLALQLAAQILDAYPAGAWLVELAPLSDPALVPRAVAAVLNVPEQSGCPTLAMLIDHLRDQRLLLLLDNCEHLIGACAELSEALLHACSDLSIITTSREGLEIAGELVWRVPSLQTPDPTSPITLVDLAHYEAVRLFHERAVFALPAFALTSTNAPAVRQICYQLDGIPLAIELAAARTKALSAEGIAAHLVDRFRLLTGGNRTGLPRQQTLRGAIDWSYNLLSEPERLLLRRLSVFAGGWTLEACEAVCAGEGINPDDVLDLLTRLVDKSLVVTQADEDGEVTRYRLLETIRQYAHERLADADEGARLRDRHMEFFAKLFDDARTGLQQTRVTILSRLAPEVDNVRAALDWSIETVRVDVGLRLATATAPLFAVRGLRLESLDWQRTLLAKPIPDELDERRAYALDEFAYYCLAQGMSAEAESSAQQALALGLALGKVGVQVLAHRVLAETAALHGDYAQAHAQVANLRDLQGTAGMSEAARLLGCDVEELILCTAGETWHWEGQYALAQQAFTQALTFAQARGDLMRTSAISRRLGYALLCQGAPQTAIAPFRASLSLNAEAEDCQAVAACVAAFGAVALAQGNLVGAARLCGASEGICESIHTALVIWDLVEFRRHVATLRERLDKSCLTAAWAKGRAMTLQQAVDDALQEGEADSLHIR